LNSNENNPIKKKIRNLTSENFSGYSKGNSRALEKTSPKNRVKGDATSFKKLKKSLLEFNQKQSM